MNQFIGKASRHCSLTNSNSFFLDAEEDHPLSREKESPWFKHFQREQLHKTILQDVDRTYPEYEFFHQDDIKKLMMDILFVYACV